MNQVYIKDRMARMKKVSCIFEAEILTEGDKQYIFKLRNNQVITVPKSSVLEIKKRDAS